ncbi:hypothetical protein [uncultured Bartonella sp.]|uniref:hypothetical protein n=1 Tax=uncultured Bartonella sp. TaxID=104108 RepID=UPI0025EF8B5D|nr:hypothetical protein [uncultured Bartonella sp.]
MNREELKKSALELFDKIADEHPKGHQKVKMNYYIVRNSELCFAFEKNLNSPANIWCKLGVKDDVEGIKGVESLAKNLWKKVNKKGEKVYGRHSGLKKVDELRDADLIKYIPKTLGEVQKVVEGLIKAAAKGVK